MILKKRNISFEMTGNTIIDVYPNIVFGLLVIMDNFKYVFKVLVT